MRRHVPLLLLLALVASVSSGCITFTNIITLKPSGSGTLETTLVMNTGVFKQIGSMMGGEVKAESKGSGLPSPEKLAKELSNVKGMRLVSQKAFKKEDSEGVTVVMAFDDVNQIAVSENLPGKEGKGKPEDEVKFSLTKQPGGTSLLTISFPDKPGEAVKDAARKPAGKPSEKPTPEAMQMISAFFKGMRVMIAVDVDGTLVRTSSPYVEGNRVTLLDIDMEQLLKDPDALQKMDALPFGPDMSISEAREAMAKAGVKGIKINDPGITIEMK
jgi:hypothetical protein